ncbi:MAG: 2-hydroxyacid dehydrogenase [Sporomusaceae bacterium]|nr:2-hydroxyacid dehydrogenase [Sporomusaceae bacterium]
MSVVLYLDKISGQMEKVLLGVCPEGLEIKFLDPVYGVKGTIEEANYFLATNYLVTKEVIDKAPSLKMVQRTGVGYDNVDIGHAKSRNVPVSITLGTNASSVAELTILFMLALYRKLIILNSAAKEGKWISWTYRHESFELLGKTIGVIGAGAIGREVIKRLLPFGVKVVYYDVYRLKPEVEAELGITYCGLDELLAQADIVTIHVPWLESTRGLIGRSELAKMKKNAVLINTARGPIVDQKALVEALKAGNIAGAGLDVFDPEPFTAGADILQFENVLTTPHIGAATLDNYLRVFDFCIANIQRAERNEKPLNVINGL